MEVSCRKRLTILACKKEENPDVCKWYWNDADQSTERSWNKRGEPGSVPTAPKVPNLPNLPKNGEEMRTSQRSGSNRATFLRMKLKRVSLVIAILWCANINASPASDFVGYVAWIGGKNMEKVNETIVQCARREYYDDDKDKETLVGECVTTIGDYLCPGECCNAEVRKAVIDIGKFYVYLHMYCPDLEVACHKILTELACKKEENPNVCKWYWNDEDQSVVRSWNKRVDSGPVPPDPKVPNLTNLHKNGEVLRTSQRIASKFDFLRENFVNKLLNSRN
ncbi:unnamed protein product [Mytilus coruscus]|uniref:Uncharacterized protein n=1 Tax=Mytilus coruscus TaxID=42192 RepID=A0A6J8DQ39_MYTCO|nr:unnamed protein product [Mytilus coruscus]